MVCLHPGISAYAQTLFLVLDWFWEVINLFPKPLLYGVGVIFYNGFSLSLERYAVKVLVNFARIWGHGLCFASANSDMALCR